MTIEVRRYEASMRDEWNVFNAAARNGHFLFDRRYMEYHADRFEDASLALIRDGRLVGLLPANRAGETIHSHKGLTFGGLVVDNLRTEDVMAALDACSDHWRGGGAQQLVYKPLPWIYARRPAQEDLYWLFRRGARLVGRNVTAAILLGAPGSVSSRRLRGAGRARKAGLTFRRSDRLDEFWALLGEVLAERHAAAPAHSLEEIRALAATFPRQITLHTAEVEERVLAGVVLFETAQVRHAQYIAASDEGRAAGALDGLFTHLIERPASQAYFDFGTSNEDGGRLLNAGLIRQKEEFGASVAVHDIYEVDL